MNPRRFARSGSMAQKMAILATLFLTPAVASAQHAGGHASGGHPAGGMPAAGMATGYGSTMGHNNPWNHEQGRYYPYYDGGYFLGGLPGYGYIYPGSLNSGGMTLADQQMIREGNYLETMARIEREQMQANLAYQQARLAAQQTQTLRSDQAAASTPANESSPVAGLGRRVAYNRVQWPIALPKSDQGLKARQAEADSLLIAVHKQALTNGYADANLISDAKDKLGLFAECAAKNSRIKGDNRRALAKFVNELDIALDRSMRRRDPEPMPNVRERDSKTDRKLADNR